MSTQQPLKGTVQVLVLVPEYGLGLLKRLLARLTVRVQLLDVLQKARELLIR